MVIATFRFYEELNDFLAPQRRRREFESACARAATTKHMIEAFGVPHTEVELVLVNGESVGFDQILRDGDRVAVYPKFEALDITPLLRVRSEPLRVGIAKGGDPHVVAGELWQQHLVGVRSAEAFYREAFDLGDAVRVRQSDGESSGFRGYSISLIAAQPNATLAELRDAMPTTAALSTVWLEIDRLGLTVKKNGTRRRTATP